METKQKHTTWPWIFHKDSICPEFIIGDNGKTVVCAVHHVCHIANDVEYLANATLIAAAPETVAERDQLKEVNVELLRAITAVRLFLQFHVPKTGQPHTEATILDDHLAELQDKATP